VEEEGNQEFFFQGIAKEGICLIRNKGNKENTYYGQPSFLVPVGNER
jgi:hypothetical protein